jgi:Fur family ferric uptake transcriptional regulator
MSLTQELRTHGYRNTAQRALILQVLEASQEHLTAAQIADALQERYVPLNRSTVYRTLETLLDIGMIKSSRIGRVTYYEFLHAGDNHHHLVCTSCHTTVHVHGEDTDAVLTREAAAAGFEVSEIEILVSGVCRACRNAARKRQA